MPIPTTDGMSPSLHDRKGDLETPEILLDIDVMERNLKTFTDLAGRHEVDLRSHAKTHKIPEIARWQDEESGGGGILCQKLGEVEVMTRNGINDILLVCPVVNKRKLDRLVWLNEKLDHFATIVDSEDNINPLQDIAAHHDSIVDVILEIDVGVNRVGVEPGRPAVAPAERIDEASNLNFKGILGHDGHVKKLAETESDYSSLWEEVGDDLASTVENLSDAGIHAEEVKTGATATAKYAVEHPIVTEINPGRYIFNDTMMVDFRPDTSLDDCAASVLATVIAKPRSNRAIVDVGGKTLTYTNDPMPRPKNRDDITFSKLTSEHGFVDTSEAEEPVEVGDRLEFVVNHVVGTLNLCDSVVGVSNGMVEEVWDVQARGKHK